MAVIVLVVHLIICLGLIGLVLLQRSEGGALGMGGGGGSLMSGRGAADALARLTSIAGGMFLATSLALTFLSGAASTEANRSVFELPALRSVLDRAPAAEPAAPPAADPLETSAPEAAETQLAAAPAPALESSGSVIVAPPPSQAATRAGPVQSSVQPASTTPASAPASTPTLRQATPPVRSQPSATATRNQGASVQPAGAQTATTRPAAATTRPAAAQTAPAAAAAPQNAAVEGESGDGAPLVEVVRRERAGPDQ